jgi:LemA protein
VRSHAKYKKETLDRISATGRAGAAAQTAETLAQAHEELSGNIGNLLNESSRELKEDMTFKKLQSELSRLERALAISRQIYNDSVMMYNRSVTMFPTSILAAIFRFKKAEFFEVIATQDFNVMVDIVCRFCGARNSATATRCTGCGSGLA